MSLTFEWRVETETIHARVHHRSRQPGTRRWVAGLLVLATVLWGTLAGLVLPALQRHQQRVEQQIVREVLDTYALVEGTASDSPPEEERPQPVVDLSPSWALQQAQKSGLIDRSALGLRAMDMGPVLVSLEIASDFSAATLVVNRTYQTAEVLESPSPVTLQHTHNLAYVDDQWQLTTVGDDFWGEWRQVEGERLRVIFPDRDEKIARRLAVDLDQGLETLCGRLIDLHCPPDMRVILTLTHHDQALAALAREEVRTGRWQVEVPAATLVGIPVDTPAYLALQRGYASQVAAVVVTEIVGWDCGKHLQLYQGLLQGRLVCGTRT